MQQLDKQKRNYKDLQFESGCLKEQLQQRDKLIEVSSLFKGAYLKEKHLYRLVQLDLYTIIKADLISCRQC